MLKHILRFWATVTIAAKRLLAQRGLAFATLLGLVAAIALVMSIPLYAEATYYRVLSEGLFSDTPRFRGTTLRPPVAMLFRYIGSFTGPIQWPDLGPVDTYFADGIYRDLKLPPSPTTTGARMFNTGLFGLFTLADADAINDKPPDYQIGLAALTPMEEHITLLDGAFPADATTPEGDFDILVSRFLAEKMGLQVGEILITYDLRALHKYDPNPTKFEVRVSGVWEPTDPRAEFWEYTQFPLDNLFFVTETTFVRRISPVLNNEIYQALWYMPMDAEEIYVGDVDALLTAIRRLQIDVSKLLPSTILDVSPVKALERYQTSAAALTTLLFTFSVPIICLIVAFVTLVVTLTTEQHRNQIAALRSRGATLSQVTGITALEGLLLGVLALGVALPTSVFLAHTIGQVRSFLDFSLATDVRVGMTWATARFGLIAVALTLAAQVVPTLGAARHTIVTYKHTRARMLRPPWWQRVWLDALLAIPAGYGAYLLLQPGRGLPGGVPQSVESIAADPFQNPLLFLVPALSLLALALLILRVIPWLMRFFAWIATKTNSVGFLLATRQLSRTPGVYAAPLGLLILTLSLSTYTASLAATLDNALYDQQRYRVGADVSLVDTGDTIETIEQFGAGSSATIIQWQFLPVAEYLKLPAVTAAARVGNYKARIQTGNGFVPGTYIGVDRTDFAQVAFWREDFATESLGSLMNQLAITHDGVLFPRAFMAEHVLNVGDTVNLVVQGYEQSARMALTIVGSFDYFPSWYPNTGPLMVGNLDYFFQEAQFQLPYRVWMRTAPEADYDQLADDVWEMNLGAQGMMVASQRIQREQGKPERQGLLGLLSVGFGAAAVLTALGFMLYALFSFRRRAVEMGVLRASGLATRHMAGFIAWELAFLLIVGGAAGTGLGIWASNLFVPTLQTGADVVARVPPFTVEIAWSAILRIYALFGALFVVALAVLVRQLLRMKLFQAIKLGETI